MTGDVRVVGASAASIAAFARGGVDPGRMVDQDRRVEPARSRCASKSVRGMTYEALIRLPLLKVPATATSCSPVSGKVTVDGVARRPTPSVLGLLRADQHGAGPRTSAEPAVSDAQVDDLVEPRGVDPGHERVAAVHLGAVVLAQLHDVGDVVGAAQQVGRPPG